MQIRFTVRFFVDPSMYTLFPQDMVISQQNIRQTFLPTGLLGDDYFIGNNGDSFDLYNADAIALKNLVDSGSIDFLFYEIITETPVPVNTPFGINGMVTTDFGDFPGAEIHALVLQPDGKIVAGGYLIVNSGDGISNFAMARYNSDGSLDTSFGTNGLVTTDFVIEENRIHSLALQEDGKIVIAGVLNFTDFVLARYNSDGSLDTDFGTNGFAVIINDNSDATDVKIQPDGKIVVCGYTIIGGKPNFALARCNIDGSLDTDFGTNGLVTTSFGLTSFDTALSTILQTNNKIVVSGSTVVPGSNNNFALVRYNLNGTLDASFGTAGLVTTSFGEEISASVFDSILQSNGKIVAAGYIFSNEIDCNFAMARYLTNGSLDTNFGTNGLVTTDLGSTSSSNQGNSIVLQNDGKLVVSGFISTDIEHANFALVRYNTNGTIDTSFGVEGIVFTDFTDSLANSAFASVIQPDQKIIVGGFIVNSDNKKLFALARYNPDGSLDA